MPDLSFDENSGSHSASQDQRTEMPISQAPHTLQNNPVAESADDPSELLRASIPQDPPAPITTASLSRALDAMRRQSNEDHGV